MASYTEIEVQAASTTFAGKGVLPGEEARPSFYEELKAHIGATADLALQAPWSMTAGWGDTRMVEDWGLLVRRFRILHGLTQEHIAEMFGVSQRTVSRWERSENKPSLECRRRLRDLGWELSGAGFEAPGRRPPFPRGASRVRDRTSQGLLGRDDMLPEDRMPIALAHRVVALLGHLSSEDIASLPPEDRRLLADQCRHIAQLADPYGGASPKADKLARTRTGRKRG